MINYFQLSCPNTDILRQVQKIRSIVLHAISIFRNFYHSFHSGDKVNISCCLFVYLCIYLSVCVYSCVSLYLSICVCICLCVYICICLCICHSISLSKIRIFGKISPEVYIAHRKVNSPDYLKNGEFLAAISSSRRDVVTQSVRLCFRSFVPFFFFYCP